MDKPIQNIIDMEQVELIRSTVVGKLAEIDSACAELKKLGIVVKTEVYVTDQWTELFKTAMYLCRQ
jgi:putative exporter of polyketide antibiotics